MGATVITNKRAAAFKHDIGTIYILLDETYEKNVYPHIPRWSVRALGTLPMVMNRIYRSAYYCEDGLTRSRTGSISAENYIADWKRVLSAPVKMENRLLRPQKAIFESWYGDSQEKTLNILNKHGRATLMDQLVDGTAHFDLFQDLPLLLDLYAAGPDAGISLWRLLCPNDVPSDPQAIDPSLAPRFESTLDGDLFDVQLYKASFGSCQMTDICFFEAGQPGKLASGYAKVIDHVLKKLSLSKQVYSFDQVVRGLKALRKQYKAAKELPQCTDLKLFLPTENSSYSEQQVHREYPNLLNIAKSSGSCREGIADFTINYHDLIASMETSVLASRFFLYPREFIEVALVGESVPQMVA